MGMHRSDMPGPSKEHPTHSDPEAEDFAAVLVALEVEVATMELRRPTFRSQPIPWNDNGGGRGY